MDLLSSVRSDPRARQVGNSVVIGAGYSDFIADVHAGNLADDLISDRLAFDERFAKFCIAVADSVCRKADTARPTALSLGCGLGFDTVEMLRNGYDAYGLELANMALTWRSIHGDDAQRMVVSDSGIPFADNSFDLITSVNVLEHVGTIPPKEIVTNETRSIRVKFIADAVAKLKPGGVFVLVAPNKSQPFDYGHRHWYGAYRWINENYTRRGGISITNPFGKSNFIPSIGLVIDACREISQHTRLSLAFLDDASLFGYRDEQARPPWSRRVNQAWQLLLKIGAPRRNRWFANQHIQAIIVKGDTPTPITDVYFDDDGWRAHMERRGLSDTFLTTWRRPDAVEVETFKMLPEQAGAIRFLRLTTGEIFHGIPDGDIIRGAIGDSRPWIARTSGERFWLAL